MCFVFRAGTHWVASLAVVQLSSVHWNTRVAHLASKCLHTIISGPIMGCSPLTITPGENPNDQSCEARTERRN